MSDEIFAFSSIGAFGIIALLSSPFVILGIVVIVLVMLLRKRPEKPTQDVQPHPAPLASASRAPKPPAAAPPAGPPPAAGPAAPVPGPAPDSMLKATILAPTVSLAGPGAGRRPPPSVEELQAAFPELQIIALIGQGGMGAVYRIKRIADGAILALKVVDSAGEQGDSFVPRFLREAEVLHKLNHPNIVAIRSHGRSGQWCWLLMDLVEGSNLRQVVSTGTFSPSQALTLVGPLCSALQYAHDQGVVHRDIKPENILIDLHGHPFLVDFGLAKLRTLQAGESLTVSGSVLGTLHYMAPEQIERSRSVDHRADIYALGVVIYELLTGRLPLGRFEPPSHAVNIDVRIDEVVLRALERNPERRWQQAAQVQQAMQGISDHPTNDKPTPAQAPNVPPPSAVPKAWGMDVNTFTILQHLACILPLGPILVFVMWITCRDKHHAIDQHGRNILDWVISSWLYSVIAGFLCLVIIGFPLLIAITIVGIIFNIMGAAKASHGVLWRYPFCLRLLGTGGESLRVRAAVLVPLMFFGIILIVVLTMLFRRLYSERDRIVTTIGERGAITWDLGTLDSHESNRQPIQVSLPQPDEWNRRETQVPLPPFTRIRINGVHTVKITVGSAQSVTQLGEGFVTRVDDGVLEVDNHVAAPSPSEVDISVPTLVTVDSAGDTAGGYTSAALGGMLQPSLAIEVLNTSNIIVSGAAMSADFKISGQGIIDAKNFRADKVSTHIPGNGTIVVGHTDYLDANITGSGTIFYTGNPEIYRNISTTGFLKRRLIP